MAVLLEWLSKALHHMAASIKLVVQIIEKTDELYVPIEPHLKEPAESIFLKTLLCETAFKKLNWENC